jgi:hypothetical protein
MCLGALVVAIKPKEGIEEGKLVYCWVVVVTVEPKEGVHVGKPAHH